MTQFIHPTAIIDESVELGAGVQIGPYSVIGPNVKIGDRCKIGAHVFIESLTELGPDNEISPFASIGAAPQDLKYAGEPSKLIIGRANKIREYVTLNRGTKHGHMQTVIGDNNLFMACTHVGHDCIVGNNNILANSAALAGHVTLNNNIIIGGMVGVHQFCHIGDYAFLAAGAMVSGDVPPYCMGQGDRCCLRGLNLIGLKRANFTDDQVRAIKKTYRHLFSASGSVTEKISTLEQSLAAEPAVNKMLEFIKNSERGICQPAKHLAVD